MKRTLLALALITGIAAPAAAADFWLYWPVRCTLDVDCYIQNYVDRDETTEVADYTCGTQTYDKHNGTDIRLANLAAMRKGFDVLSPAEGKVIGARNDMDDVSVGDTKIVAQDNIKELDGKECGNGVHISSRGGWRMQLCHMKKGSVTVKAGDRVKPNQILGQIGMSGNTNFPHLHITVWKDNKVVDPFSREEANQPCNPRANLKENYGLWTTKMKYRPIILLGSGFATEVPDKDKMRDTPQSAETISMAAPAVVFWADLAGVRGGDELTLRMTGPDGRVFAEHTEKVARTVPLHFVYLGKRNKATMLPGNYTAQITITRDGSMSPILQSSRTIAVTR